MLYFLELILFIISVTFGFPSQDPMQQIDGSKFAFVREPYGKSGIVFNLTLRPTKVIWLTVNTFKAQKDLAQEGDVSLWWPNAIVRYYVDGGSYDYTFGKLLLAPIVIIESSSCIQFKKQKKKPSDNKTWIHITNPGKERDCNHDPRFKDNGEIELVFGYDCLKTKEMLHTLLHGIGIRDEVTHPHRDKYIRVLWDNIHPAYQHLYRKQAKKLTKNLVEYDPLSVMHFHDRDFSRNGHATIVPLVSGLLISPSDTLSQLDKMRLQMYFGHECNKRTVSNLLNTCKKSLGAGSGEVQSSDEEDQYPNGDYPDDIDENSMAETDSDKNKIEETQTTDLENSVSDDGEGEDESQSKGIEARDPNEKEQNAEEYNAEEYNAEEYNAEEYNAEEYNESEQLNNNNENEQGKNGPTMIALSFHSVELKDTGNNNTHSTSNKKLTGKEDIEGVTKDTENIETLKGLLTESAYENDIITERTLKLTNYNEETSDVDSDVDAVKSYHKNTFGNKQSSDEEIQTND